MAFADLTAGLGAHNLAEGARVVYEKPFGTSPENFRELNEAVHKVLDESQVYRIDHFLGKEATQDLHVLRFANSLFANAWNAEHIKSIQIDAPEKLDIDDRALFYDATGAMLDMLITHLFQVAAEVAMEPPASMDAQRPAVRPRRSDRLLPAAGPGRGGARSVRRLSGRQGHQAGFDHRHLRGRPDVGGQRPLARSAVPDAHRQADGRRHPTGQRHPPRTRPTPPFEVPKDGGVLTFSLAGNGAVDLSMVVKEPGPGLDLTVTDASDRARRRRRAPTPLPPTSG